MRKVEFHRRATAYLRRMPAKRRDQVLDAVEEVAALGDIATHQNVLPLSGTNGWFRLRIGSYRAVLQPRDNGTVQLLYVDWVGPRGQAYR